MSERRTLSLPKAPPAADDEQGDTLNRRQPIRPNAPRQRSRVRAEPVPSDAGDASGAAGVGVVPAAQRPERRDDAPARQDRPARPQAEREPRGNAGGRSDRAPRDARGGHQERPAYNDRPPRHDRPARDTRNTGDTRGSRDDRPRQDRPAPHDRSGIAPSPRAPSPHARPDAAAARQAPEDGRMRLSKLMSEQGLSSRREADEWIEQGWVRVDGEVVSELGTRVWPHQTITVDKIAREQQAQRVTILLNKPIGYVSGQAEDGHEPAVVLIRPENRWADDPVPWQLTRGHLNKLAPAGRLDIDSTGLLVLTQDGRIAKQLIGEDAMVEKEYLVRVQWVAEPEAENVSEVVPEEVLERLRHGLRLDERELKHAKVSWQNEHQLRFVLREGRKRQIRRMCELVGLKVVGLKRVRMGQLVLGKLPPGQWRFLGPHERF